MFGYGKEGIIGKPASLLSRSSSGENEAFIADINKGLYHEGVWQGERRVVRKDGAPFWCLMAISAFTHPQGEMWLVRMGDITARKRLEEELAENSEEVRDLYENAPCGYHSLDKDGVFLRINETERAWLDRPRDEIVGKKKFSDFLTPQSQEVFRKEFPAFMERGWVKELEFEVIRRDGTTMPVLVSSVALKDADGHFLMTRSTVFDITGRKQAEEVLRQSGERMRLFFELQQVGMALTSPEKGWMMVNDPLCQMLGYSREELMAMTWAELTYPEDMEPDLLQFNRMLKGEINNYSLEKRFVRKNRSLIYTDLSVACVRRRDGTVDYVLALLVDITERKRLEEALRQNEQRLQMIINTIPIILWTGLPDGYIDFCNSSWLHFTGMTQEQIKGTGWMAALHPDDVERTGRVWREACRQGVSYEVEQRLRSNDGSYHWFLARAVPIKDAEGNIIKWYGSNTDITGIKKAEEEVRRLNEGLEERVRERTAELEAANKELESFNYSASHDLRTPLRAVDGFSHALLEDCAPRLDEAGKDYLNRIRTETHRMGQLIDDMLMLSRIGRTALQIQPVDLGALARRILADLQESDPGRQVEVRVAGPLMAEADPNLMGIALSNLLGNAWKFTAKTPQAWIEFGQLPASGPHAPATFFVRDNGAGFDMAYADKLFAAFQRLHRQDEFPGTGVGLATVARIIHRHGGEIRAEGAVGRGATFFFTLEPDNNPISRKEPT